MVHFTVLVNFTCDLWTNEERKISGGKKILQGIRQYIRPVLGRIVGQIGRGIEKKNLVSLLP